MGGPRILPERVEAIRELKGQGFTDMVIARRLGLTYHQVHYVRYLHGIGGHYSNNGWHHDNQK